MLTYQYRLNPTKNQLNLFFKQLEIHKELYNQCLEEKIESYKSTGKSPSCFDQIKSQVKNYKGKSNYSSLQQTVRRLDKSYQSFFKMNNSFPRFKNRFRTIEFAKIGDGCQFKKDEFYFQYLGKIKCKIHRQIPKDYKIKTMSLTYKQGNLYVNVYIDKQILIRNIGNKSVGIDFGIKTSITTSDNQKYYSPRFTKNQSKNLARLQRKKEKTNNNKKIKKSIAKIYCKTENRRKDFNHKLSRKIVNQYDIVCLEDLKVSEITTNISNINSRIYDIGISQLKNYIKYKAENAGKQIIFVNPEYTSQTCSQCNKINKLKLKDREYKCSCGLIIDRDLNASKNILRLGLQSLSKS